MMLLYSWELENYLASKNNIVSNKEYKYICKTCPQIDHIKYNAFENCFDMWTTDGNHFRFQVYYDGEKG